MVKINTNLFSDVARDVAVNLEAESEAIKKYQELRAKIQSICSSDYLFQVYDKSLDKYVDSLTAKADRKLLKLISDTIEKYIAEEMKHLKGLQLLYETMTGISAETKYLSSFLIYNIPLIIFFI